MHEIQGIIMSGILGACLGSFLNVAAHRTIQGRSWWGNERSECESCGHILSAMELIPIVSWLIQGGKCRKCGAKISVRYILVEILGMISCALIFYRWRISWAFALSLAGFCSLLINSLTDIESGDVFDAFAIFPGVIAILIRIAGGRYAVLDGLSGALAGWGIFAAIIFLTRGGMGWGDAVFMGGIGAILGLKFTLFAFYAGIMTGGLWVIILMLTGKVKWGRGDSVPLVPFLATGCFITLIFGPEIFLYLDENFLFQEAFKISWPYNINTLP